MPLLVAIETSAQAGSVAVMAAPDRLWERCLPTDRRTIETLIPTLDGLLAEIGRQPGDVDIVAVTRGPGSFTGLRIGLATAKTLAFAWNAALVAPTSFEVLAAGVPHTLDSPWLSIGIDAQRGEVYEQAFQGDPSGWQPVGAPRILSASAWKQAVAERVPCQVAGPAVRWVGDDWPSGVGVADSTYWTPQASRLAQISWIRASRGQLDDALALTPLYLRASAAEERRRSPAGNPTNG